MTVPNPGPVNEYIGNLYRCSCSRQLRLLDRKWEEREEKFTYTFMPCPCIAEKKGVTSEPPVS